MVMFVYPTNSSPQLIITSSKTRCILLINISHLTENKLINYSVFLIWNKMLFYALPFVFTADKFIIWRNVYLILSWFFKHINVIKHFKFKLKSLLINILLVLLNITFWLKYYNFNWNGFNSFQTVLY